MLEDGHIPNFWWVFWKCCEWIKAWDHLSGSFTGDMALQRLSAKDYGSPESMEVGVGGSLIQKP